MLLGLDPQLRIVEMGVFQPKFEVRILVRVADVESQQLVNVSYALFCVKPSREDFIVSFSYFLRQRHPNIIELSLVQLEVSPKLVDILHVHPASSQETIEILWMYVLLQQESRCFQVRLLQSNSARIDIIPNFPLLNPCFGDFIVRHAVFGHVLILYPQLHVAHLGFSLFEPLV